MITFGTGVRWLALHVGISGLDRFQFYIPYNNTHTCTFGVDWGVWDFGLA